MAAMGQPPAADSQPDVPGQLGGDRKGADPMAMHEAALGAEKNLEKLATLMGKADAPDPVVKAVSSMADAMRQIISSMAKAPAPDTTPPPAAEGPRPTMQSATNELAANARR